MLNFLMNWPVTKPRVAVATVVAAIVTFVYGQTTFCEDVYFAVGEYPCVFLRVSWAVAPLILFVSISLFFFSIDIRRTPHVKVVVSFRALPFVSPAHLPFKAGTQ